MTSAINPNNIDGAYPVAGQDNDSQGFRDNFTNTKTNFEAAAAEITDLQNKVLLKAPLTGGSLNNDMGGSALTNAVLSDMAEPRVIPSETSGNITINYAAGPYVAITPTGPISLNFTNFPPAGQVGRLRIRLNITNVAYTLTLPATVSVGTTGIQGWSSNVITFATTGIYEFEFETSDGGTTITIFDLSRPLVSGYTSPLTLGSALILDSVEDVADAATISLSTAVSYFVTDGAESSTLPAGATGQIKILVAKDVSIGNMVVNVANAGWTGSGTITFTAPGQTATMLYVESEWYCIGLGPDLTGNVAIFG